MPAPLILRDFRTPGRPLKTLPLKLPADRLETLQDLANRLQCSRSALGRALLLQGLEQLEQITPGHHGQGVA